MKGRFCTPGRNISKCNEFGVNLIPDSYLILVIDYNVFKGKDKLNTIHTSISVSVMFYDISNCMEAYLAWPVQFDGFRGMYADLS